MLDNDNLTYSYQKRVVGNTPERALITLERSQKLDLLIHLLANLQQALIVCGPEGIGKTTLLQTLQTSRQDQWRIFQLQGSSSLSFETVINSLSRFLNLSGLSAGFDLSSLRAYCQNQKVVLVIDDAGELVPGLIGELVDLSESMPGLRLVFSMTYDEFHIKSTTDKAVDDCHFIELPPLNLKQCAEYLQNLSAQPGAVMSFNAVTDSLVEELYRETHGIPGKILAEIPKFNQYQSRKKIRYGLWLGVAVIASIAGWSMKALLPRLPSANDAANRKPPETTEPVNVPPAPVAPNINRVEPVLPATETHAPDKAADLNTPPPKPDEPQTGIAVTPAAPSPEVSSNTAAAENKAVEPTVAVTPNQAVSEAITPPAAKPLEQGPATPAAKVEAPKTVEQALPVPPQPAEQVSKKTPEPKPEKPSTAGSNLDWIMAQPPGNYTLQIMVLSNKAAVNRFLKKYADYSDSLKYYTIGKNDQEKYVLIYGSFQSIAEASKYKTAMPGEFNRGLEKRFKFIQKESRR